MCEKLNFRVSCLNNAFPFSFLEFTQEYFSYHPQFAVSANMSSRTGEPRKISFNVSNQYEIQDVVGEGAYGIVWYVFFKPLGNGSYSIYGEASY